MNRDIFNPGDSAFFQTAGTLHGEKPATPRVDALDRDSSNRVGEYAALARDLERESARLRAALASIVACCDANDGDSLANAVNMARAVLAGVQS